MKRIISILFLIIYLFSTTEAYQFSKLPLLLEHYKAHKAADKTLTLYGFLREHYESDSPDDPDYAADMKLPFKTHNDHIVLNIFSLNLVSQPSQLRIPDTTPFLMVKEYNLFNNPFFSCAHLINIWQPPKTA